MKAAATWRGDWTGTPTSQEGIRSFTLPADVGGLGGDVTCYAGQPNQTAACAPALGSLPDSPLVVESGVAAYNPLYYALVGWPSLILDGGAMVFAMRLVNAVVVAGLWTVSFVALGLHRPRSVFILCLAATPFALYLGGVVNPSGAEVAATAAVVALLDLAVRRRGRLGVGIPLGLGVALGLLINLRSLSPVFALAAVLAVAALHGFRDLLDVARRRSIIIMSLLVGIAGLFALAWTLLISQPAGFIPSADPRRPAFWEAFVFSLEQFPAHFVEMIGVMGWFDAWPPLAVHIIWGALSAGVLFTGLVHANARKSAVVFVGIVFAVFIPAILQAATASEYGYIWQGRYALPFLVLVLLISSIALDTPADRQSSARRYLALAITLAILHCWTFVSVLKRFAVGADADWALWFTESAWQPPAGSAVTILLFCVAATGLSLAMAINVWMSPRHAPQIHAAEGPARGDRFLVG